MSAKIALYYHDSGYLEAQRRSPGARPGVPAGLMGRQVAGKEFLDAFLRYGAWDELSAVVPDASSAESLSQICGRHPSSRRRKRRLAWIQQREFHAAFSRQSPAELIYFPCPPDIQFAWARHHLGGHRYALSGVTHTLCSAGAVEALRKLVTAPFEPYDRLICTSRAVIEMVRRVTDTYAEYLRERHGGSPGLRIGLETIPLGVDAEKFAPASAAERDEQRKRFQIAEDQVAVLFVGRLAHHAKAHPFPMYRGVAEAARRSGRRVHLLVSGWAASDAVLGAFREGAAKFAGEVQVSFLDGMDPEVRFAVWRAADLFISLSDNIQETFGLVILEAMASGLPVVATDWNGYRDLVAHGQTGFLVPTAMVDGATADVTSRLLIGEINYDHFLAETSQAVAVDTEAAAEALQQLIENEELRVRMGRAGRQRVLDRFHWAHVIRSYEALWQQQAADRRNFLATHPAGLSRGQQSAAYPPPERTFEGYPSRWLRDDSLLQASPDGASRLAPLLRAPLTSHEAHRRCTDESLLQDLLSRATSQPRSLGELAAVLAGAHVSPQHSRATIAWLLKYDLLQVR